MDTRQRNAQLEHTILNALWTNRPNAFPDVMVRAMPDGSVWLGGVVASQADCTLLKKIVSNVPGVQQVFCNVAPKTELGNCRAR